MPLCSIVAALRSSAAPHGAFLLREFSAMDKGERQRSCGRRSGSTFITFLRFLYFFLFPSFLLRQKRSKKGDPKTMTAVFGWFFEELLCKEVKGSGDLVNALDPAFQESVTDVDDKSGLSIDRSILSSFNPSNPNSDNNGQKAPRKRRQPFSLKGSGAIVSVPDQAARGSR